MVVSCEAIHDPGHREATMADDAAEVLKDPIRVDTAEVQICKAGRYERSPERVERLAGHYERRLETKADAVVFSHALVGGNADGRIMVHNLCDS